MAFTKIIKVPDNILLQNDDGYGWNKRGEEIYCYLKANFLYE